jgi:hypothetical protein
VHGGGVGRGATAAEGRGYAAAVVGKGAAAAAVVGRVLQRRLWWVDRSGQRKKMTSFLIYILVFY